MKSKTYEEFVEKFKPKLTTDDCYTPPLIWPSWTVWTNAPARPHEAGQGLREPPGRRERVTHALTAPSQSVRCRAVLL